MAGTLQGEYDAVMAEVMAAVQSALAGPIREGLEAEIARYAEKNVYSYPAAPYFMAKRRYSLNNRARYDVTVGDLYITVDGSGIALQRGDPNEIDIVESGSGYQQPYPRPYMEEALHNYIASGEADRALAYALAGSGFEAHAG